MRTSSHLVSVPLRAVYLHFLLLFTPRLVLSVYSYRVRLGRYARLHSATAPPLFIHSVSGLPPSSASSIMVDHCARRSWSNCQWRCMHSSRKRSRSSISSWLVICFSRPT